jgi:hypothetical protein
MYQTTNSLVPTRPAYYVSSYAPAEVIQEYVASCPAMMTDREIVKDFYVRSIAKIDRVLNAMNRDKSGLFSEIK